MANYEVDWALTILEHTCDWTWEEVGFTKDWVTILWGSGEIKSDDIFSARTNSLSWVVQEVKVGEKIVFDIKGGKQNLELNATTGTVLKVLFNY